MKYHKKIVKYLSVIEELQLVGQTFGLEFNICAPTIKPNCHTDSKPYIDCRCEVHFDVYVNFVFMWYFDIWKKNYITQNNTGEVLQFFSLQGMLTYVAAGYRYIFLAVI